MAKQEWLEDKCKSVEECIRRGKVDTAYRKIRETFGDKKSNSTNIKNSDGKPVISKEGKAERWKEYIEQLYKGNELRDNVVGRKEEVHQDEIGDTILRDEFDRALKDLGRNKAPGVDDIPSEILKSLGEPSMIKLFELVCRMYETGEIPPDFMKSVIIPSNRAQTGVKIREPSV